MKRHIHPSKKIAPANGPKQCAGRSSGSHGRRRYKTQEHASPQSMSVFSFHMRFKVVTKKRCFGSSASFTCKSHASPRFTRAILQDLCKVHLSGSFTEPARRIHVSGFSTTRSMDPLQDLCFQVLEKSHASGSMSRFPHHEASTRCTSPDLCLSILICGPLQDPCRTIHYKISGSGPTARSMSPDHLTIQDRSCRIHVSASMFLGPYTSILVCGPLQDPRLRIHYKIRGSMSPDPCLPSIPQHLYLWMLYARSMSLGSTSATPLEDPCVRARV